EARARQAFILGELAAGRNPTDTLAAMAAVPAPMRTFTGWAERYEASRVDAAPATRANIETHIKALAPTLGERDPHTLGFADVQDWIAGCGLSPGSVRTYMQTLRQVLDFAGCDPNPARDKRVKLPEVVPEEIRPPTGKQFLAVLDKLSARWVLP